MKPALSPQTTGFLPRSPSSACTSARTSGSVTTVRMISTRFCTGAGLKKWTPTTRPGLELAVEISVTLSEEVLVARTASGADDAVEHAEDRLLDLERLDDRLDDEVGVGEVLHLGGQGDPAEQLVGRLLRHLLALHRAPRGVLEVLASALDGRVVDLDPDDCVAVAGEDLGDAGAHGAEADDADGGELASSRVSHGRMLPCRPRIEDVGSVTPPGSREQGRRAYDDAPRRPVGPGPGAPPSRTARAAGAACPRAR